MAAPHSEVIHEIRAELEPLGTHERAVNEKRYLKSDLDRAATSIRRSATK